MTIAEATHAMVLQARPPRASTSLCLAVDGHEAGCQTEVHPRRRIDAGGLTPHRDTSA